MTRTLATEPTVNDLAENILNIVGQIEILFRGDYKVLIVRNNVTFFAKNNIIVRLTIHPDSIALDFETVENLFALKDSNK